MNGLIRVSAGLLCLVFLALAASGCGQLADPDRVVIARMGDEVIRREDLRDRLRNMLDTERPVISSRGDLRRELERMIDERLKAELAAELRAEGKLDVPREQAARIFDMQHPEFIAASKMAGSEEAREMGFSEAQAMAMEQERELRIDELHDQLVGDEAVAAAMREAVEEGKLEATEKELRQEYEFRREQLLNWEHVAFDGLVFPQGIEADAASLATEARRRLRQGASVEDLAAGYAARELAIPLASQLERNPMAGRRFEAFWQQASGAREGDVIGPLFIEGWQAARQTPQGEMQMRPLPPGYLVARIIESTPQSPKTFEQAKEQLRPIVLYAKMVKRLWDQNDVEIYEEKLPDPAGYDPNQPRSVFDSPAA